MHDYDVIIIGAGIGGLTCGALLAKHGMNVLICEQHDKPGGYCTSYKRGGFTFDVPSLMGGMREGSPVQRILSHLAIDRVVSFIELDTFCKFAYPDVSIDLFTDFDRLQDELQRKLPSARNGIASCLKVQRDIWNGFIASSWCGPHGLDKADADVHSLRMMNMTCLDFLRLFLTDIRHVEIMGSIWPHLGGSPSVLSILPMVKEYMSFLTGGAWFPRGGYQVLSDAMADSISASGGLVRLKGRVKLILVDDGCAVGVRLDNGELLRSRCVVSNADTRQTLVNLIGQRYLDVGHASAVRQLQPSYSGLSVHLAVDAEGPIEVDYGDVLFFPSYGLSNNSVRHVEDRHSGDEPARTGFGLFRPPIPPGSSSVRHSIVAIQSVPAPRACSYRRRLDNRQEYEELKDAAACRLIQAGETLISSLSRRVLVKDICTPATYERYTGATNGCWYDMVHTPEQLPLRRRTTSELLKNLYLTGAKSYVGIGIFGAILGGFDTADAILGRKLSLEGVLWK